MVFALFYYLHLYNNTNSEQRNMVDILGVMKLQKKILISGQSFCAQQKFRTRRSAQFIQVNQKCNLSIMLQCSVYA